MQPRYPPFAKYAKSGAPTVVVVPESSKAWATRRFAFGFFGISE
jgi:hypothetical protein